MINYETSAQLKCLTLTNQRITAYYGVLVDVFNNP